MRRRGRESGGLQARGRCLGRPVKSEWARAKLRRAAILQVSTDTGRCARRGGRGEKRRWLPRQLGRSQQGIRGEARCGA
eukprot:9237247-Alexandrium_andersonii.AAC.1